MVDEEAMKAVNRAVYNQPVGSSDGQTFVVPAATQDVLRRAITAYLQALSPGSTGETEGWRDIESAPKDWTDMLLHDPEYDNDHRKVFEGYYDTEAGRWRDAQNAPVNPTHWRPLPAPPSAMLSAAGER